ncbi:hypothetical protein HAZT_HAZT001217 [Hyalella azteca]|uniref:SRCR domain-containing protein n=1 Tax=Hyalella azteca TaxID=294128 RepID=A0A6A0GW27_HYAAZ|nr:hypothetical protein HAZT_HAZT001217 [Hyalella azteca]
MGDMFGGMGGSQDGMSGMFGGMGSSQGGMNGMFGGMGGPQGGMGGMGDMFGGMGGSQGGMSGMFGGMGGPQGGMSTSAVRRGPEGSGGNVRPTDGAGSSRPPNFDNSRPPQNTTPFESGDRRTSLPPMTSNSVTNNIGNNAVFSASSIGPQSWGEQSDGSFICKDGTRIDLIKIKCDGFTDCRDKSDEANCTRRFRRDASIEDVNSVEDHNSTEDRNSTEDHNSVEETNSWENDNDDRSSMFPRPGRHGGGRGGGRNFHCSAKMKEMLEMKKVISMMFMQLVNSEPDNMKGFTFLPLARNALAGDSESLELLDLSLQYMDASKPYLARMHDIKSRMMEMMKNDRTKMRSLLSGKLGTEPTLDERCMRLSGDVAQAMNSAQITQQEVSTIFESPFDMMQEDGNSESSSSSVPIYWRVENQDVLRGERCFATGAMTWSKVAVCSCKESAVRLPPVMFGPQPFGMNGRGGSDEDMGVGNEIFGMGGGRPGGGFRGIGGGEGPSRGGFFGRGGSRDGDQNGDDDNDNSGGSGMMFPNLPGPSNSGGSPIIFPGSSIDLSTIQNIISNSISNPDGSLNLDALKNIFANQASGGLDLGSIFGNVGSQISPNMTPQATSNTGGSAGGSGGFDINSLQSFFNSNGPRTGGPMSNFNFAPLRSGNNRPDANRQINLGAENRNRSDAGRPDANRQINLGAGNRNRSDAGRPFDRDAGWHNSTNNSSRLSHIELNHRSEMELQDGTLQVTGEVLVGLKLNGSFDLGSICADSWNSTEALVVCNVLANRLSRHEKPLMRAQAKSPVKPPKTPMNNELNVAIKLGGVKCQGNETDIMQCTHSPWGPQSCPGNVKATVTCIVR